MCRKRQAFSWRSRVRRIRFIFRLLPLNDLRMSRLELRLQTVRTWSAFPRYFGTAPVLPSGKNACRSGCANPAGASASSTTAMHPIPSPARDIDSPSFERARSFVTRSEFRSTAKPRDCGDRRVDVRLVDLQAAAEPDVLYRVRGDGAEHAVPRLPQSQRLVGGEVVVLRREHVAVDPHAAVDEPEPCVVESVKAKSAAPRSR